MQHSLGCCMAKRMHKINIIKILFAETSQEWTSATLKLKNIAGSGSRAKEHPRLQRILCQHWDSMPGQPVSSCLPLSEMCSSFAASPVCRLHLWSWVADIETEPTLRDRTHFARQNAQRLQIRPPSGSPSSRIFRASHVSIPGQVRQGNSTHSSIKRFLQV